MSVIIGIDYSLTSPALCVHSGEEWKFENCSFYGISKKATSSKYFSFQEYPAWNSQQERYKGLTTWVLNVVEKHKPSRAYIEDYAYGAKGKVFHIAENTGLMKYGLYVFSIPFEVISPTSIKKFATGKGNANKELMIEHFLKDTGVNIYDRIGMKDGNMTPASDLVDAYWIAKNGFMNEKNNSSERPT